MKRKEEEKGDIKNWEIETMKMEQRKSERERERERKRGGVGFAGRLVTKRIR